MGHFCWICGRERPNEAFSGKGRRKHECRKCQQSVSPADRARLQITTDLNHVFDQTNISEQNIAFARTFVDAEDDALRTLAQLVVDVGTLHPRRQRRDGFIATHHPELWRRMIEAGVAVEEPVPASDGDTDGRDPDRWPFFDRESW